MKSLIRALILPCLFSLSLISAPVIGQEAGDDEIGVVDAVEVVDEAETEIIEESIEDSETSPPAMSEDVIDHSEQAGGGGQEEPREETAAESTSPASPESFVLQGHPIFTPDQAELVYQPLVSYLNEVLPYRFDLQISRDFHRYWLDVRRGLTPDLVLEDAHITAFRMRRDGYTPLVRAAEPMTYSLLASPSYMDGTLRDLVGQPVSSMPSPSLGYLVLSRWYENPMQQPIIQSNASSWLDAIEIVFSMEAEAAIVPRNLAERYVNLEVIETSSEFPGITLSASPAVPATIRDEIRQALLVLHESDDHIAAVHELDIERFENAAPEEYEGLDEWLSEVVGFL